MGNLTIIRGLPGAGKSRLGHRLAERSGALFLEPDQILTCGGRYCYTPAEYRAATRIALDMARRLGRLNCDLVYADVLPTWEDVERVVKAYGAPPGEVRLVSLPVAETVSLARNRHAVRPADIRRMAMAWEAMEGEETLVQEEDGQ